MRKPTNVVGVQGFGEQFVHGGEASTSVPSYVDPYALLLDNYNDPYYPTGQ